MVDFMYSLSAEQPEDLKAGSERRRRRGPRGRVTRPSHGDMSAAKRQWHSSGIQVLSKLLPTLLEA